MDNRTEQLADGLWQVEVGFFVNAFVLANDGRSDAEGLTLVDTGTRAGGPRLVRSIRLLGLDPRACRTALLTHWHADHAGSAARFAGSSAGTTVHASAADLAIVTGRRPPPTPRGGPAARAVGRRAGPPDPVPTAAELPAELSETAGGITPLATPGHTAGHVAFWLPACGALLAGDALFNVGRLAVSPRAFSHDWPVAVESAARLGELPVELVAVGHGAPVTRHARDQVMAAVDRAARRRSEN